MKRYFQILLGGGMLSLLALQSQGAISIPNSGGSTTDGDFTIVHWANSQPTGGPFFAFDRNAFAVVPGDNDVFSVNVGAGQVGTFRVWDLGSNSDRYNIMDSTGTNILAMGTDPGVINLNQNILSPNAAFAAGFSTTTLSGLAPGAHSFKVGVAETMVSQGILGLNFESIPEPSVGLLSMLGLAGLFLRRRRS